ncbi:Mbeg1-like protein [Xiamenia xianingshaonis]|uniref:DUF2974 domain-containing protein n=1 Tax=Xiamenia xianingshaonis TaxID=2682776 RepID=A0A9E6MQ77_9ACTN|nr:Mbeg1-like protein [Xiamenia xianingshaonis]NHM14861.1 DUF2974 domain-containing protein [Xiamenia xianingshaonis]QTU84028.1 DUF2974 domain-containing protein [Xiamenia xianingshaonis]
MTLLDYLGSEFSSFDEKPLNPIDSAIFSEFAMLSTDWVVPPLQERASFGLVGTIVRNLLSSRTRPVGFKDVLNAQHFPTMFNSLHPEREKALLIALAASPRFSSVQVAHNLDLFDVKRQTQFFATAFIQGNSFAYLAFRGTDTSITGWREDCNMIYEFPVPAQVQALRYLETLAPRLPRTIYLGGHSKGGNLAEYAALHASPSVQSRIECVFNHDAPGFQTGDVDPALWEPLAGRIHRTVPTDSFIGMLLETPVAAHVVKSNASGLAQHSTYTWLTSEDDFVYASGLSSSALLNATVMKVWMESFDRERRKAIVEALFAAIEASGVTNATEVFFGGMKAVTLLTKAARALPTKERDVLVSALAAYAETYAVAAPQHVKGLVRPKAKASAPQLPNRQAKRTPEE